MVVLPRPAGPWRDGGSRASTPASAVGRFGPERVLGCVVYPAAEVGDAGHHRAYRGQPLHTRRAGRPSRSAPSGAVAGVAMPGLKAPVRPRHRDEIWVKLWGNLAFNPISALTHATLDASPRSRRRATWRADDAGGTGDRREAGRRFPDRRRAPDRRGRSGRCARPRCCRISSAAGRWRSMRW